MKKIFAGLIMFLVVISVSVAIMDKTMQAQDERSGTNPDVEKKLDEILNNQKAILDGIASVKEELGVIKIRITQQQ